MKVKYQYRNIDINGDFKCLHCRHVISSDSYLSGVINRNHCPYCLYSRHLDLYRPGDRLSACKGAMKPAGLTLKRTNKKYGGGNQGELMLIHLCTECERVSINRIAADDVASAIYTVYTQSLDLSPGIRARLRGSGVQPLAAGDDWLVRARLFGIAEGVASFEPVFA